MIAPADEAHLLALGPAGGLETGGPRLLARLGLGLLAQREPGARQDLGRDPGEHVRLILVGVGRPRDQAAAFAGDHAGVVAGGEAGGADAVGEVGERVETKAAVAAHARVGRASRAVLGHKLVDDHAPEVVPQVEADVSDPQGMAGRARGAHRLGRAARAL